MFHINYFNKYSFIILSFLLLTIILYSLITNSSINIIDRQITNSSKNAIKIGVIEDLTGETSSIGIAKKAAYELAVDEINQSGGINGRMINLIILDGHGDVNVYQKLTRKLIKEEKVDVLMGAILSSCREAIRKIVDECEILYFYNHQYEGGVTDHYTFCISVTPDHQISPLAEYLIPIYGKTCYIVAADYNFGQITALYIKNFVEQLGGNVIGTDYIPLESSDFDLTLDHIASVKPNIIFSLLVGGIQSSFFEQFYSINSSKIPIATSDGICEFYEHKLFDTPIMENTYVFAPFIEELDTPQANAFKEKFRTKYPFSEIPYMIMDTETAYSSIYLYKLAIEKVNTTETEAVISALESGSISFDGPGGIVTVRGEDHHTIRDLNLFRVNSTHGIDLLKTYPAIYSHYIENTLEVSGGLKTLGKDSPNIQYIPSSK